MTEQHDWSVKDGVLTFTDTGEQWEVAHWTDKDFEEFLSLSREHQIHDLCDLVEITNDFIEDTHYLPTTEYIKKYGQCFVFVTMPDGDRHYYGVFSSGLEALAWMDKQYKESQFRGSFACVRLRTPDRVRTHEDWYAPERLLTEEEFNAEYPTPTNQ